MGLMCASAPIDPIGFQIEVSEHSGQCVRMGMDGQVGLIDFPKLVIAGMAVD